MATLTKFEDILAWQEARTLCRNVWDLISKEPFSADFKLCNQINAACGSIMDNIAEGFERDGNKEFIQFLSISKASCAEVKSQLYRALDRGHINNVQFEEFVALTDKISKLLAGLMNYLKSSEIRGSKFQANNHKPQTSNQQPVTNNQ